jgi:mannose-1-phosphate guanylyltransferase
LKALLIAGGFGTRLRPLTLTRPKHLLPVANEPHLFHVFDLLQRHGIDELVLLTSYLAETFTAAVKVAEERGMTVHVTHEEEPLGTAGAIKNAEHFLDDETFFAFNGDILTAMDLSAALSFHRERSAEATIVLTPVDDPSAYGVVPTDEDGRVRGFIEKPAPGTATTNLINAGVYIFEPSVLERIPAGAEYSAERALFPGLVDEGARLFGVASDAYWMDIGTPAKYLQANLDALSGAFPTDLAGAEDGSLVDPEADVDGASITSSVVGAGAVVAAGAALERCVLLPGARVEASASLRGCILGEVASVAEGVSAVEVTLGDGERLEKSEA